MLKVTPNPTFDAPVEVPVPGQVKPEKITVTFKYKSQAERDAFLEKLKTLPKVDALMEIIAGWTGVDVEFSREALENVLANYAYIDTRFIKVFFDEHHKALAGN